MSATVRFSDRSIRDQQELFDYLHPIAGERIARDQVAKLYAYCLGFSTFPERGTSREDLRPGLRVVGYRRRATIAFALIGNQVTIIRIFSRRRDVEARLKEDDGLSDS